MSGRKNIVVAEITEGKLRGKAMSDALAKELLQDEKKATYQNNKMSDDKRTKGK